MAATAAMAAMGITAAAAITASTEADKNAPSLNDSKVSAAEMATLPRNLPLRLAKSQGAESLR